MAESLVKETVEKYVLHRIVVRLGLSGPKLEKWKTRRKRLSSKMTCGHGVSLRFKGDSRIR